MFGSFVSHLNHSRRIEKKCNTILKIVEFHNDIKRYERYVDKMKMENEFSFDVLFPDFSIDHVMRLVFILVVCSFGIHLVLLVRRWYLKWY